MKLERIEHKVEAGVFFTQRIVEASYDEWTNYLFDHPESERHWTFEDSQPIWSLPKPKTAEYVARTLEDPDEWMRRYSTTQIASGLEFIWNTSLGEVSFVFVDSEIDWPLRKRAIQALVPLYECCYQKLCTRGLSHLDEATDNHLNGVCYMFWDVCPLYPSSLEQDQVCLRVMEQTLQIDHDACRESSLHGLGHWASGHSPRVHSIIEQSLKTVRKRLRRELLSYATQAQAGCVQ